MIVRRWKAFLRLNGETLVDREEDVLNEFKGFVQALKRVGIDYSIVVDVERVDNEHYSERPLQGPSITSNGVSDSKRTESLGD